MASNRASRALPMSRASWVRGWVAVASTLGLLLGAVGQGLRVPSSRALAPLPHAAALDYSRGPRGLVPLRRAYVCQQLHCPAPGQGRLGGPVAGPAGSRAGGGGLSARTPPGANDDFEQAVTVDEIPFRDRTSTASATAQHREPEECGDVDHTIWYRFTPPARTVLAARAVSDDFAPKVCAYVGTRLPHLRRVQGEERGGSVVAVTGAAQGDRTFLFVGDARRTYHIQVGTDRTALVTTAVASGGGRLAFFLTALPTAANDDWAGAIDVRSIPFRQEVETLGASAETGEPRPCSGSTRTVWFRHVAQTTGFLAARATNARLAVYTGTALKTLEVLKDEDGNARCAPGSLLSFRATRGMTYFFQVSGEQGRTVFAVQRPRWIAAETIDEGSKAALIRGLPFLAQTDIRQATRRPRAANCVFPSAVDRTVWFQFAPERDASLAAEVLADFGLVLVISEEVPSPPGSAVFVGVGCVSGTGGRVTFDAVAGRTYRFSIGSDAQNEPYYDAVGHEWGHLLFALEAR